MTSFCGLHIVQYKKTWLPNCYKLLVLVNLMELLYEQIIWISISFGSSLIISFFLPFYIALPLIIAVFSSISFIRHIRLLRRASTGENTERTGEGFDEVRTKYRCLLCGSFIRGNACSNCGSKMKKADFYS
jgi:hypothetical protein